MMSRERGSRSFGAASQGPTATCIGASANAHPLAPGDGKSRKREHSRGEHENGDEGEYKGRGVAALR
jgi:hypothetical protein